MGSFTVVTWIGNAAAVLSGRWGAVSRRAQEVGCSRKVMYQQARRGEQAVVAMPVASNRSLTPSEAPCSGPRGPVFTSFSSRARSLPLDKLSGGTLQRPHRANRKIGVPLDASVQRRGYRFAKPCGHPLARCVAERVPGVGLVDSSALQA